MQKSLSSVVKGAQPHTTIDVRDSMAPISLLKVENRLAQISPGQTLEILCTGEETKSDLLDITRNSKHRCIAVEENADHFKLLIEKHG